LTSIVVRKLEARTMSRGATSNQPVFTCGFRLNCCQSSHCYWESH
jgi:hypothetical protein